MVANSGRLTLLAAKARELIESQDESLVSEATAWKLRAGQCISEIYGEDSYIAKEFKEISYASMTSTADNTEAELLEACKKELRVGADTLEGLANDEWVKELTAESDNLQDQAPQSPYSDKVFIVHGHDYDLRDSVACFVREQGLEPVILDRLPNKGMTLNEKLLSQENLLCAICLYSSDDWGRAQETATDQERARQNVVYETGLMTEKVGRDNVIYIVDKEVELPSDLHGIVFIDVADWQNKLLAELKSIKQRADNQSS